MTVEIPTTPQAAFEAAERGDFTAADRLVPALAASTSARERAWALALDALRVGLDPRSVTPPSADAVAAIAGEAPEIAVRACAALEGICPLAFDRAGLEGWMAFHTRLGDDLQLDAARAWRALMAGELDALDAAAQALFARASKLGAAAVVTEATVVRGLAALARGDLAAATDHARRAARMAQAEGLPRGEYLAHIALARIRRHTGRPHLAAHILTALARVAPPAWHGWLAWELLLAGSERRAAELLTALPADAASPAVRGARALLALLEAARAGDRAAFDAASAHIDGAVAGWQDVASEARAAVAAIDHTREDPPVAVARWRSGETAQTPAGLHGVGAPQTLEIERDLNVAYVIAGPGRAGRRALPPGLGLAGPARRLDRDDAPGGAGGRADQGLAVLLLAGEPGLSRDRFFETVYEFRFQAHLHQDALDVLVHRMRQRLGDAGEIARADDLVISLSLREELVVPDVRCALPIAERVLRALALAAKASAQEAARLLGLSLRTVQKALQELVADGSCTSERIGNQVAYRLHDTTFTEVTYLGPWRR